jgi:hypothetical protein
LAFLSDFTLAGIGDLGLDPFARHVAISGDEEQTITGSDSLIDLFVELLAALDVM